MDPIMKLIGLYVEKDRDSVFTKCNQAMVEYACMRSEDDLLGLTDRDLLWEESAGLFRAHEEDILKGNIYSIISPVKVQQGKTLFLQTKIPKTNEEGLVCGILSRSVEILNPPVHQLIEALQINSPTPEQPFYLGKNFNHIPLPKRQEEVLFYLVRGKSAKTIAKLMGISFRTVEYYTTILKDKFNCATKNELIEEAISKGFSQYISPQKKFTELLEKLKVA